MDKVKEIFLEKEETSHAAESARPTMDFLNKTPARGQLEIPDVEKSSARPNTNAGK